MQRIKRFTTALAFSTLIFVLTIKVGAVSNTICLPGGGCWTQCVNAGDGGSGNIIGASQLRQCSPEYGSNCSGNNWGVCGVNYTYSGPNCDPTTIENSYYVYSYYC
jgi:hypothetical protein